MATRISSCLAVVALSLGCAGAHNQAGASEPQNAAAVEPKPAGHQGAAASTPEAEHQRVKAQFEDPRYQAMLNNATFNALQLGEQPMNELVHSVFVDLKDSGDFDFEASVQSAGGIAAYKQRIASYLTSTDVTARGIAALALAIVSDPKYVEQLVTLLRSKELPVHEPALEGYDRGMAMLALAVFKASEYRAEIETYTNSKVANDSAGAKAALELMDH